MRSHITTLLRAVALARLARAIPWLEPSPTPTGLMAVGFSPKPTEAPGGLPRELRRSDIDIPENWCGYIGGNTISPLSCYSTKQCVYSGTAVGCCDPGPVATCTNLFTSCINSKERCGSACQSDENILKCDTSSLAWCAVYTFSKGYTNFNCDSVEGTTTSVDFISDVLSSEFGTSSLFGSFGGPIVITDSSESLSSSDSTRTRTRTTRTSVTGLTAVAETADPTATGAGTSAAQRSALTGAAIAGIVVAALTLVGCIGAAVAGCCLIARRRRRRRALFGPNGAAGQPAAAAATAAAAARQSAPPSYGHTASEGKPAEAGGEGVVTAAEMGQDGSYAPEKTRLLTPQATGPTYPSPTISAGTIDPVNRASTVSPMPASPRPREGSELESPLGPRPQEVGGSVVHPPAGAGERYEVSATNFAGPVGDVYELGGGGQPHAR
ncbi:MAG: hypothetical protein M1832_003073 [Thelocarpon impressellum]|nr:MAG: hypothetical protein M1832_003073 [Thelocarpon impressellum]